MNVFKVGEETHILDGYNEDCTVFEVDEAGLNIFYYYSSPTEEEMQAFEPGVPGEIRLARIDDILFLFCKLGTLAWAEMPYAIQLSKLTNLPKPEEGEGYNLTIMLIDRDTSIIKKNSNGRSQHEIFRSVQNGSVKRHGRCSFRADIPHACARDSSRISDVAACCQEQSRI